MDESQTPTADTPPSPEEAEARMRALIDEAGLAPPDEVRHEPELDELHFYWREPGLVVVVELHDRGAPDRLAPTNPAM